MKNKLLILLLTCFIGILSGCSLINEHDEIKEEEKERITLNKGAIVEDNYGRFTFYNLKEGKYEAAEMENTLVKFNTQSGNYIFDRENKYFVNYEGKEIDIDSLDVINPSLSFNGQYLSYFTNEGYFELKIKDLKNEENIEFESDVAISGELVGWISDNTLIYYGIDDDRNNGLFTFNVESKEEKFLYSLEMGYVEYLKVLENEIAFIQERGNKNKSLKLISLDGEVQEILEGVSEIKDVAKTDDGIYLLGKVSGNNYSIYKYSDNKFKRLIFDFPKIINLDKGLSKDENGNLLFMGHDTDYNLNNIYMIEDESISLINSKSSNYYFIEFN